MNYMLSTQPVEEVKEEEIGFTLDEMPKPTTGKPKSKKLLTEPVFSSFPG